MTHASANTLLILGVTITARAVFGWTGAAFILSACFQAGTARQP